MLNYRWSLSGRDSSNFRRRRQMLECAARHAIHPIYDAEPLERRLLLSEVTAPALQAGNPPLESSTTVTPTFINLGPISAGVGLNSLSANPNAIAAPYTPSEMRQAYGVNLISFNGVAGDGSGETIALIEAYDDPDIISDANTFSANYGLQQFNGGGPTLTVRDQNGGTNLPRVSQNGGWDVEESLDVEWAHAIAPGANIVVFEATTDSNQNLFKAVQSAADYPGVSVVSMSWGGLESIGETSSDSILQTPAGHQGVTFLGSSSDESVITYPSASPGVIAVGGTTLTINDDGSYGGESAWGEGGGGVSAFEPQPSYQNGNVAGLESDGRDTPDVSMDADPNTGVPVLDSEYRSNYVQVGGTSLAAPMWAGLIAIANQGRALNGLPTLNGATQTLPGLYNLPASDFNDITLGSNGHGAGPGYDLSTGLGTPIANLLVPALANQGGPLLVFAQQPPSSVGAGAPISPVIVDVDNPDGTLNTADNSAVTLAIFSGPVGAKLGGTLTVNAVNGVATFSDLSLTAAGTYSLGATDHNTFPTLSGSFSVTSAPAYQLAFASVQASDPTPGTITPLSVDVKDQYGNLVNTDSSPVTVSIDTSPAGATLSGTQTVNAVNGVATFSNLSLITPGIYSLQASDLSLAGAVSISFGVGGGSYKESTVASFNGADGQLVTQALIADSSGNLYGISYGGGANGAGAIFEIAKGSNSITLLASFPEGSGILDGKLAMDSAGNLYATSFNGLPTGGGEIYELAKGSSTITTVFDFGFDGSTSAINPYGGVIVDSAGDIFGTTAYGGDGTAFPDYGDGTLFELPQGASDITILHSFDMGDGFYPAATLYMDSDGNLYGTTQYGGVSTYGTVFEIASGTDALTTLAQFNINNGQQPEDDLVMDSKGDLFGTTPEGGAYNDGTVFEIPFGGSLKTLVSFDGIDGNSPPGALVIDRSGNLYGTTDLGGTSNDGTVFEITAGTDALTILYSFSGIPVNGGPDAGLTLDSNGDLFGTTFLGGTHQDGSVFELRPPQLAFTAQPQSGPPNQALNPPVSVAVTDLSGNLLTGDTSQITLSLSSAPSGATLGGTITASVVNGVATFNNLIFSTPGKYTLTATDISNTAIPVASVNFGIGYAPQAVSATVNGNFAALAGVQRSMVDGITYTFSEPVILNSAISLMQQATGGGSPTPITFSLTSSDNITWNLTFPTYPGGSLPDGIFDLTVNAADVTSAVSGMTMTGGNQTFTFDRLFGDIDGNGTVNNADYFQFKKSFGQVMGSAAYNPAFDYDANGIVNNADYFQFKKRYGQQIVIPAQALISQGGALLGNSDSSSDNTVAGMILRAG